MRRRQFVKFGLAAAAATVGGTTWWLAASNQRGARWTRRIIEDSRRAVLPAPLTPEPAGWSDNRVTLAWLGHSTVLVNFYGLTILTDPALAARIGISLGPFTAGPKRYIAPALSVSQLPRIDVLLLSHAHMDHMDVPSLRQLPEKTFTVTAKLTTDVVARARINCVHELGWNEEITFRNQRGELQIQAIEVKHWGKRWPSELERGYNGYILRRGGTVLLFAGDTALTPALAQLRSRGPFAAAVMPIGAYRPWIWSHCTPEQAVEMATAAGAQYIVPVHHQTFKLSEEPLNEPLERLQVALASESQRLALRQIGETFVLPA